MIYLNADLTLVHPYVTCFLRVAITLKDCSFVCLCVDKFLFVTSLTDLCRPDLPASSSLVLGLKACATMPGCSLIFYFYFDPLKYRTTLYTEPADFYNIRKVHMCVAVSNDT